MCVSRRREGQGAAQKGEKDTARRTYVGDGDGVADLLVGHVLDEEAVVGRVALGLEVLDREEHEPAVEQVELDELLVEGEVERLEVCGRGARGRKSAREGRGGARRRQDGDAPKLVSTWYVGLYCRRPPAG